MRRKRLNWKVAATVALCGCAWITGPDDVVRQTRPFYYYQGQPIYLDVDPSRLTIEAPGSPEALVRDALRATGVAVDSLTSLHVPDHWVVWLSAGSSADEATTAAATLRQASEIRFASAGYELASGECPITLVNRFGVAFKPQATREQIDALNARLGVTRYPEQPISGRWLRYPSQSSYTPLEIAAHYDRHELVDWASPDMIGCFRPL